MRRREPVWIGVLKRVPRINRHVVILDLVEGVDQGGFRTPFGWCFSDGTQAYNVTHWMPMRKGWRRP